MTTSKQVPFLDLKAQYPLIRAEVMRKLEEIISDAAFILGKHVEEFEREFARAHGARHCLGVSSGTDALHIALEVLGVGRGDRVVVPVNTFIATAEAVSLVGAEPVFVDCDGTYNVDPKKVRQLLEADSERRIKAILPVHLYGRPADMTSICAMAAEFGVAVVEDAAQAHLAELNGVKVGSFGALAAFSFYPGKNLGAFGEAGALLTNDSALYERAKLYRQHGEITRYHHVTVGHNYRMEAIQGAVLATKLEHLASWTAKRRGVAALYRAALQDLEAIVLPPPDGDTYSVNHLFVIQSADRDRLREHLAEDGVATGLHYPVPLHLQPAYAALGYGEGDFPSAEAAARRIVSLPMFPELTKEQIVHVCDSIRAFHAPRWHALPAAQDRPRRHAW
jgi:dTDP-4-amino-4,6-dideoxygalactose transaminase